MMLTDKERRKKFDDALGCYVSSEFKRWLVDNGFFVKPAAISHHGNYTGGLFDHSYEVMEDLVEITQKFNVKWQDVRSPWIVGMFHDLCKRMTTLMKMLKEL